MRNISESEKFSERLVQALEYAKFPTKGKGRLSAIAEAFHISPQAASKWLGGKMFPAKKVPEIAEKLGVNAKWLLTGQGHINPFANVFTVPGGDSEELHSGNWQKVPIISWQQAGEWHHKKPELSKVEKFIWATTENTNPHFALITEDDSMEPRFYAGNILIFDPDLKPVHKNRVLVKFLKTNQVMCGILNVHGLEHYLKLHNPDYKPILLDDNNPAAIVAVCRQVFIKED